MEGVKGVRVRGGRSEGCEGVQSTHLTSCENRESSSSDNCSSSL